LAARVALLEAGPADAPWHNAEGYSFDRRRRRPIGQDPPDDDRPAGLPQIASVTAAQVERSRARSWSASRSRRSRKGRNRQPAVRRDAARRLVRGARKVAVGSLHEHLVARHQERGAPARSVGRWALGPLRLVVGDEVGPRLRARDSGQARRARPRVEVDAVADPLGRLARRAGGSSDGHEKTCEKISRRRRVASGRQCRRT